MFGMGTVMEPSKRMQFRAQMTRTAIKNLVEDANRFPRAYDRLQQLRRINPSADPYYKDWEIILDGVFSALVARSIKDLKESLADIVLLQASRIPNLLAHSPLTVLVNDKERNDILNAMGIGRGDPPGIL